MSEQEQTKPLGGQGRTLRCDEWENLLADALDGTLSVADQAAFTRRFHKIVGLTPGAYRLATARGRTRALVGFQL